jgi:hypothetical protein
MANTLSAQMPCLAARFVLDLLSLWSRAQFTRWDVSFSPNLSTAFWENILKGSWFKARFVTLVCVVRYLYGTSFDQVSHGLGIFGRLPSNYHSSNVGDQKSSSFFLTIKRCELVRPQIKASQEITGE